VAYRHTYLVPDAYCAVHSLLRDLLLSSLMRIYFPAPVRVSFLGAFLFGSLLVGVVVDVLELKAVVGLRSLSRLPMRRHVLCSSGPYMSTRTLIAIIVTFIDRSVTAFQPYG
jgi:hypothetical protein